MTISLNKNQLQASNLITLGEWQGIFSNQKQSFANPQLYAHIHIFFRPIPVDFFCQFKIE
jgi:CpeT protein